MHRHPLASRMIVSAEYDEQTNVLELEFAGGDIYQYFAVPPSVAAELFDAESPGTVVNRKIKPRYSFRQVGDDLPRGTVRRAGRGGTG